MIVELRRKWTRAGKTSWMTLEQWVLPSNGRTSYLILLLRKAAHTELREPAAGLLLAYNLIWIAPLQSTLIHKLKHLFKLPSNKKNASDQELLATTTKLKPVSIFPWLTCPNSEHKTTQETSYIHKASVLHAFSPHKINPMWTCFFTVRLG